MTNVGWLSFSVLPPYSISGLLVVGQLLFFSWWLWLAQMLLFRFFYSFWAFLSTSCYLVGCYKPLLGMVLINFYATL